MAETVAPGDRGVRPLTLGCGCLFLVTVALIAALLLVWWLVQPGGLLHDSRVAVLAHHARQSPP